MHKKSLLLSTATAAIVLFSAHFNVHAATLSATGNEDPKVVSGESYQATGEKGSAVSATSGGKIDGTNLTLTGKEKKGTGASASGSGSVIDLKGKTTIKDLTTGLKAKDSAIITMTAGSINADKEPGGRGLFASKEAQIIMNGGSIDANVGVKAQYNNATVTLNDAVIITSKKKGLSADNEAQIIMNGGSITADETAVESASKSFVELNKGVKITSKDVGLIAKNEAQIMMNGGSINADIVAVEAKDKGSVNLNGVTIKSEFGKGTDDGSYGLSVEGEKTQIAMNGGSIDVIGTAVETKDKGIVKLSNVEIKSDDAGLFAEEEAQITMNGGSINAASTAVWAKNKGLIDLNDVAITSKDVGLLAEEAKITMHSGSITADKTAVDVKEKSTVNLNGVAVTSKEKGLSAESENATITMMGGKVNGKHPVYAKKGGQIKLTNVAVTSNQGDGLFAEGNNTKVIMNGGSITAIAGDNPHTQEDGIAFYVKEGGQIDVAAVSATADKIGLDLSNEKSKGNKVNFTNTKLIVKNGTGIYLANFSIDNEEGPQERDQVFTSSEEFDNNITLKNSEIRADVLLQATDKATATLTVDHSILEGRVGIAENDNVIFNLNNGSQWILKASKTEKDDKDQLAPIANRSRSEISVLNLNDSSVVFGEPTEDHYQTLQVGSGNPGIKTVYNAKGNAKLYLNAEWSDGQEIKAQKADHLLIKGNVSGSTAVYVNAQGNATEAIGFVPWNKRGISLIQVSGKAEENSFKLANGYTTVGGLPYKYIMNAYGPESSNDLASADQMLFEKDLVEGSASGEDHQKARVDDGVVDNKGDDFWDFRLQNQYLANSKVKALVPQMANYLVMPSALFSTGFTDIENQNALLTDIRTAMPWDMKNGKRNPFFLSSYGSKTTLSSNRTGLEYGYGANIGYAAIQTGVALAALEGQNTSSYFGLLGTYGKLSFTPQNMADVDKTALEKWGITAYSSVQHNGGVYLNALLSYGFLKGNIFNAVIGRTAKLDDANTWSASATLGKKLVTSVEGLIFEPQVQIAYQQLLLGSIQDADNFKVDMGNPHQWAVRMGGRLTKNVNRVEDGHLFSFYGKLNLISTFGDEGTIRVGDSFHLDPMGSAIEGGIGVNAQLFQNIAFHGDISYQQKLQKAGISGATLSGGLKYRF
ncbi:autotransporter outer membrane beta-barrel domain-containing protein [Bartonella schoenbuchensis]|uniref:autotransporter outer membrane beta-barrel domain-containing protein n=1 Tax=Bartonella schoenbuchensis TaxID=165694 RepID=UPI0031451F9D